MKSVNFKDSNSMMDIVTFLEHKPVLRLDNNKLMLVLLVQCMRDNQLVYDVEQRELNEVKAFSEFTSFKFREKENMLFCYTDGILKAKFIIDKDNAIYKIVDTSNKISIVNIEKGLEITEPFFEIEEIQEPISVTVRENQKKTSISDKIKKFFK
ncbi:MAG: hypothetical protein Q4G05_04070 [Clostridia bacterium]|nr:hypothetical protein [Clostridia bacterium]